MAVVVVVSVHVIVLIIVLMLMAAVRGNEKDLVVKFKRTGHQRLCCLHFTQKLFGITIEGCNIHGAARMAVAAIAHQAAALLLVVKLLLLLLMAGLFIHLDGLAKSAQGLLQMKRGLVQITSRQKGGCLIVELNGL